MEGYGNPRLSMDEAGYYLTTLEAAAAFIEHLKPEGFKKENLLVVYNTLDYWKYQIKGCFFGWF